MAHIEQFVFEPVPNDPEQLSSYLQILLDHLSLYLTAIRNENPVPEYNTEPDKPHLGQLVIADGTNWNPGSGRGLYIYYTSWTLVVVL